MFDPQGLLGELWGEDQREGKTDHQLVRKEPSAWNVIHIRVSELSLLNPTCRAGCRTVLCSGVKT